MVYIIFKRLFKIKESRRLLTNIKKLRTLNKNMLKIVKAFVNNVPCYFQIKSKKIIAESTWPFHLSGSVPWFSYGSEAS